MKKTIFLLSIIIFVLFPTTAFALERLEINYPALPVPGGSIDLGAGVTIWHYFEYLAVLLILLTGFAAVISLIYAGVIYLTTVGNPSQVQKAWKRIKISSFSIIVILGFYLILGIINPFILNTEKPPIVEGDVCLVNTRDASDTYCFSGNQNVVDLKEGAQYKFRFNVEPFVFYGLYLYSDTGFKSPLRYVRNPAEKKYAVNRDSDIEVMETGGNIRSIYVDVYEPGVALYDESCGTLARPEKKILGTQELNDMKIKCVRFRYTFYKERSTTNREGETGSRWIPDYAYGLHLANLGLAEQSGIVVPGFGEFASVGFPVPKGQKTLQRYYDLNKDKLPASNNVEQAQVFRIKTNPSLDYYKNHELIFFDKKGQNIGVEEDVKTFKITGNYNETDENKHVFSVNYNGAYYISGEGDNPTMDEIYDKKDEADRLMSMEIPPGQNYVVIMATGEELEKLDVSRIYTEGFSNITTTEAGSEFGDGEPETLIVFISED